MYYDDSVVGVLFCPPVVESHCPGAEAGPEAEAGWIAGRSGGGGGVLSSSSEDSSIL